MNYYKTLLIIFLLHSVNIFSNKIYAQCCAGGSGSPIAVGGSQGLLQEKQIELNTNFQFSNTNKFYSKDKLDNSKKTFDSFSSTYEYFRIAYGVSRNFTLSVESGYYFNIEEVGLNKDPASTYQAKGIGDLILFPRFNIINWTEEKHRTEVTIGLGFKIPLGSYNDSSARIEPFSGEKYYITKPTAVQLSTGAQDLILYTFLFRGYTDYNFRVFTTGGF